VWCGPFSTKNVLVRPLNNFTVSVPTPAGCSTIGKQRSEAKCHGNGPWKSEAGEVDTVEQAVCLPWME